MKRKLFKVITPNNKELKVIANNLSQLVMVYGDAKGIEYISEVIVVNCELGE